ncbi:MAG: PAS domain-containing protein [Acetobacteraceae bacterium]
MRQGILDSATLQRLVCDALDQSDDLVVILELLGDGADDLVVAAANEAFCRTTGFDNAALSRRPMASLAAPETGTARFADLLGAAREGRSIRSELRCLRASSTPFWLGLHLMPVRGTVPPCFVILGRDITESLLASQQQAAIQGLLAKVFHCVRAPVSIVSETGVLQMANPALDELIGYPVGGTLGKRALDFISPATRGVVAAARQRQVTDGLDYTVHANLVRLDGSEIPVELTSITVQREDLRRFRIVTILRDAQQPAVTVHVAGKIRLIGLDDVKEALGERWGAVAARAMASAEHVIRRGCGPRDTFSRTADSGFLICFADASEEEAAFRAAVLAREIRTRLIGSGESEAMAQVSAVTASVDVPDIPGRSADMLAEVIGERLATRLAEIEARARETLREAIGATLCRLEPVRSRRTREVVAHFARMPPPLERRVLAAYSSLPLNERQGFDFDRLVLGLAAAQAITDIADGGALLVLVNVDFEVFLDRRRTDRYVAACQALDTRLRARLVLVLSDMPKGFPKSRVLECVTRLRPFCRGIGFQSEGMEPPAVDAALLGSAIIVLRQQGEGGSDQENLERQIATLHAHRARVMVRHLVSWEAEHPLSRLGVDLVTLIEDERDVS